MKDVFTGRKINFIDSAFFKISGKRTNGWLIGNRARNVLHGKRKYVSRIPVVFVVGCPRSGTTLLQTLLKSFKELDGTEGEVCLFQDVKNYDLMENEFGIEKKELEKLIKMSKKDVVLLSELILKEYGKNKKIKFIVLKAPKYILFLKNITTYFPNSKIIHIIRDGRDVSVSTQEYFLEQTKKKFLFEYGVRTWVVSINQGKKFRENKNYLEVRYENLVEDPYNTLKNVSEFLQVKPATKKRIFEFYKALNPKKVISTHRTQLLKPIYKDSIGKYKDEMMGKQKTIFKKIAGNTLKELNYEKNSNW